MKHILLISFIVLKPVFGFSQGNKLPDPEPYFAAIIVANIDTSIDWYSNILGFKILNRLDLKERGFKQANLKRGNILIELIETNSTIYPKDILVNQSNKTRMAGFFKLGFRIPEFTRWMDFLTKSKVKFQGTAVKDKVSGKKTILILDPDGNRIQLFEK